MRSARDGQGRAAPGLHTAQSVPPACPAACGLAALPRAIPGAAGRLSAAAWCITSEDRSR